MKSYQDWVQIILEDPEEFGSSNISKINLLKWLTFDRPF